MSIRVIDLFAGAGGFSVGFHGAGFKMCGAIETEKVYAQTYRRNFPDAQVISCDIRGLSPKDFVQAVGVKRKEIDLVIGGPPCQSFSSIGQAKIRSVSSPEAADHRDFLFEHYFDYVAYFKPPMFVMENVPTMRTKAKGRFFERVLELASKHGYTCEVAVLNAVEFGVPQTRNRLFVVGHQRGIQFSFPEPAHVIADVRKQHSLFGTIEESRSRLPRTVYDAIGDLPFVSDGAREDQLPYSKNEELTEYQLSIRNPNGVVGNNICRVSNDRAKRVFARMAQGQKYMDLPPEVRQILPFREDIFHDRLKRLSLTQPSWTVLAHIGMDGYMYIHPTESRTLSVREAARIQSFPDWFAFTGNMREQYIQVGNAVPPLLARAVAERVSMALS